MNLIRPIFSSVLAVSLLASTIWMPGVVLADHKETHNPQSAKEQTKDKKEPSQKKISSPATPPKKTIPETPAAPAKSPSKIESSNTPEAPAKSPPGIDSFKTPNVSPATKKIQKTVTPRSSRKPQQPSRRRVLQVQRRGEKLSLRSRAKAERAFTTQAIKRREPPKIFSIFPSPIPEGEAVTITGRGFTLVNNEVFVRARAVVDDLPSPDGISLTFTLPVDLPCSVNRGVCPLKVANENGISNAKPVKLTEGTSLPPEPEPDPEPTTEPPPEPEPSPVLTNWSSTIVMDNVFGVAIVWNGNGYGVAYISLDGTTQEEIYFAQIDVIGKQIGESIRLTNYSDLVSHISLGTASPPTIVWDGSSYGIAWVGNDGSGQNVHFAKVTSTGQKVTEVQMSVSSDNVNGSKPALVWTGAEYALVWAGGWPSYPLYFAKIRSDGATFSVSKKVAGAHAIARAANGPIVSITWNSTTSQFGVSWQDVRESGDSNKPATYAAILDSNGSEIVGSLKISGEGRVGTPTIFADGASYDIFWRESAFQDVDANSIYFANMDARGLHATKNLNTKGDRELRPSVAKRNNGYGITWESFPPGELYFKTVDLEGNIIKDNTKVSDSGYRPQMTLTVSGYAAIWTDEGKMLFAQE